MVFSALVMSAKVEACGYFVKEGKKIYTVNFKENTKRKNKQMTNNGNNEINTEHQ